MDATVRISGGDPVAAATPVPSPGQMGALTQVLVVAVSDAASADTLVILREVLGAGGGTGTGEN
jgi:hypothetical protein